MTVVALSSVVVFYYLEDPHPINEEQAIQLSINPDQVASTSG
jgi:hypothetical protein